MTLRDATPADLAAITAIYAHHVAHGSGTFEEGAPDTAEMARRMARVQTDGCAWLVTENDGQLTGFGYYMQYRDRSAYRFTAEDSIYVRDDVRGQGVGKALVAALLDHAAHRGFRQIGVMRAVGMKFGRWVDVVTMQRPLGEADRSLPE